MSDGKAPLELFHPLIREWFIEEVGTPTEAQALAWPRIAAGEHVLVSAPTGSGKTLTAFLWAIDRLITGAWSGDRVRVLYISPLRALNTDVRRNLKGPLAALRQRFESAGTPAARVQVMTRSGDTPQSDRRKMLRHPPEILVTTPESLNILLTSRSGRTLLGDVRAVILDEIHALAASKRGTHLLTAVERLVDLSGEFQRIALSATVKPMETVAEMVGGYEQLEGGEYLPRPVSIVRSTTAKTYDVKVRFPVEVDPESELDDESMWQMLTRDFRKVIERHGSTLIFANSRRMTEKATRLINMEAASELAYSHHGSLSREVRAVVEKRLKEGELRAIVATNSLELGIDIGALDQVLLIQTPRSVASAVQRVGRAGHGVGEVSRGVFYPTFGRDLLESAVVARAVAEQDIESLRPVRGPLDVLAQVILSMATFEAIGIDELYDRLRRSWPYRHLLRRHFDRVLDMLAGRFAETRVRELKARVHLDRVRGTVKARPGVERLLYMAGGTIADRGYFALRHQETMAKIGELDEEFVWERSIGDSFTLGTQSWRIQRVTHNDVLVTPGRGPAGIAPFWRADAQDRGFYFCQRVAAFLERAESRLGDARSKDAFRRELEHAWRLEPKAAEELLRFLAEQREATGGHLPRRDRLLVEYTADRTGKSGSRQVILHTMWGGAVNRPFGMALAAAWDEKYPDPLEIFHDDYCVLLRLPEDFDVAEVLALLPPDRVEQLLRSRLEDTGFFGSRFRWAAGTSLLLPKAGFRQRMPLWMSRQKAKKLYEAVRSDGDFPMVVETWRTCLQDEFELEALKKSLGRLREGSIELQRASTERPSPFCAGLVWQFTNQFMYDDDTPEKKGVPGLRHDVLEELVHASHLRPRLPAELVQRFASKVQRLEPGYAPAPGEELALWLEERLLVPSEQWRRLVGAVARDHEIDAEQVIAGVAGRALEGRLPGAGESAVGVAEGWLRVLRAFGLDGPGVDRSIHAAEAAGLRPLDGAGDEGSAALDRLQSLRAMAEAKTTDAPEPPALETLIGEWLRFDGPVPVERLAAVFGLDDDALGLVFDALEEARSVVTGELSIGAAGPEVCDAENLEILLRWLRSERRPSFEVREAAELPLFLAHHQGLVEKGEGLDGLQDALERLFGLPLPAALWESDVLPARLAPYYPSWLDACLQQSELLWVGCGKEKVAFGFESDLELFLEPGDDPRDRAQDEATSPGGEETAPGKILAALGSAASMTPDELSAATGLVPAALHDELWQLAWQGLASNETWLALRQGLRNNFQPIEAPARRRTPRRGRRRGWRASTLSGGRWRRLETPPSDLDALEREELNKDRVRLLLGRYGVLFRELLARELPPLAWSRVFRTLRLMELSGEVLAGYFFKGARGLQFITHGAFRDLGRGLPRGAVYWLSAADPASLAGVAIEGLKENLPARRPTNHLVYRGTELVLISKRRGAELEIRLPPEHPRLAECFAPLENMLAREVDPLPSIAVETINGETAAESDYARRLGELFRTVREGKVLRLWKRF